MNILIRHKRKIAQCTALLWTLIYSSLSLILIFNPNTAYVLLLFIDPTLSSILMGLLAIAFVISMPISIVLMWIYYRSQKYIKLHLSWICPLVLFCLLQGISLLS